MWGESTVPGVSLGQVLLMAVEALQRSPSAAIQQHFPLSQQWATPPAMALHESIQGKHGTSPNRWVSTPRGPPHTSVTATAAAALIIMRSIGLGLWLLAISRIGISPFPLLPLFLLPLFQGCGWLLPALTHMTDALYCHRPPRPRHTTRGTVAQSEESAPALRATRTSARVFPRFQGAPRTACRGPGTPPLTGLGMITKPRACQGERMGKRDSAWFCSDRKDVLRCTFHWLFLRTQNWLCNASDITKP